jgi:hypothetical protein
LVLWIIYITQGQPVEPAFGDRPNPPANWVVFVAALLPAEFLLGIETIAVVPQ